MAFTFPEEALRAVQNAFPVHETLPPAHAEQGPFPRICPSGRNTLLEVFLDLVTLPLGTLRVGSMASLVHADGF